MRSLQTAFLKRLRKAGPGGPGYGPSRHPQSGKGMGVPGGIAKPGWAKTDQPIPGGGSREPVKPNPALNDLPSPPQHGVTWKAVQKAVHAVMKHKDARGSTAHHKRGGGREKRPALGVPEQHQLRIARDTLRMNPAMVAVMGGPSIEESKKIIQRLTGR